VWQAIDNAIPAALNPGDGAAAVIRNSIDVRRSSG
jgi:hypothetical protein